VIYEQGGYVRVSNLVTGRDRLEQLDLFKKEAAKGSSQDGTGVKSVFAFISLGAKSPN
jgi:hypothetical protein